MYKEFYLMRKEPFDSHPSPELFYKSNVHQTAWHYLVQGIKQQEPILVLAGDYGAGKTLLFLKLVRLLEIKGKMPIVAVPTPTYNFAMILEKIVEKLLNISPGSIDTADEAKLQQAIYEYFENTDTRAPIYVVIDDAQEFSYSFINKLRLFASYNCGGFFPIRLIFFAHHSFLKMLTYKKLVALGQRIKRIYHLKPLNYNETREYIYFRLIHSGATGTPVFDDQAVDIIQNMSGGNPRLINNICDNCLLVAGEERVNIIDPDLVYMAMEKGSLPGIEKIERPVNTPAGRQVPDPLSHAMPQGGDAPRSTGIPRPLPEYQPDPVPQYAPQYTPHQYPQQALPPQYQAPASPPYAAAPPSGYSGQGYEQGVAPSFSSNFWSRYGRIGVIILLLLIALFLASYLFKSHSPENVGAVPYNSRKIIRKMPVQRYTIYREIPAAPEDNGDENTLAAAGPGDLNGQDHTKKRYVPVLLTDSLEI